MANRTYYGVHAIGFAPLGSTSFTPAYGVQSIGMTLNFNLEQVFELGQIEIYDNIEGTPDVEVNAEKVLDGECPLYLLATNGAGSATLAGRSVKKTIMAVSIYDDAQDSSSGTPLAQCTMSGLLVSSVSYTFPSEGNFTESITLVGTDRTWKTGSFTFTPTFSNNDTPESGVNRRQDLMFKTTVPGSTIDTNNHINDPNCTILPGGTGGGIYGISSSGTNTKTNDVFGAHLSNITVSVDLGREDIFELGRRVAYFRFAQFPTPVNTEVEQISTNGDQIGGTEAGLLGGGRNLSNKSIRIATREGLRLELGTNNKLQSVAYNGGDSTGGNVTLRYSYQNFNRMDVKHWNDITTAIAATRYNWVDVN